MAMAYSLLVTSVLSQIINSWPNKKLMDYSYFEQLKDMLPQIALSVTMGIIVLSVNLLQLTPVIMVLVQLSLGVIVYIVLSKIFHVDIFEYMIKIIKSFIQ